jgi:small subunit ribosomal protein S16
MVTVRLYRTGAKSHPSYRIVVMDSRKKRQGRVIEQVGTYDPLGAGSVQLREEALAKWIEKGATLSDTVASLVRRQKRAAAAPAATQAG